MNEKNPVLSPEITLDFIQLRIREQEAHIEKLMATAMEPLRKIEVLESARGVLKYWQEKLGQDNNIGMINKCVKPVYFENDNMCIISPKTLVDDLNNIRSNSKDYLDQLASVLPPSEEFESMAAKITQPFSLNQVLGCG